MNTADFILIAIIAVALLVAVRSSVKNGGKCSGCSGDCSACTMRSNEISHK